MSDPVCDWLARRGFDVFTEVPLYGAPIDVVGAEFDIPHVVAIEMKTALTEKVIRQASTATICADEVYCAVPTRPRSLGVARCRRLGIGVLRVTDRVDVLSPSFVKNAPNEKWREHLLVRLRDRPRGGTGGLPNMNGVGPAQEVFTAVQRLRAESPRITWREMFSQIPNHYANYRSMQGAMRMVVERRAYREKMRR